MIDYPMEETKKRLISFYEGNNLPFDDAVKILLITELSELNKNLRGLK